jgi:hypothetical protein
MATRRTALVGLMGMGWLCARASTQQRTGLLMQAPLLLAATWEQASSYYLGLVAAKQAIDNYRVNIAQSLALPTRAHGVLVLADGALVCVARRPGDWLVRWPQQGSLQRKPHWHWAESGRVFNGHGLVSPNSKLLFTTETDLQTGAGLVGVRDAQTLHKTAEWPTHGIDPHALVWDASQPEPCIMVANGGIDTRPETGRAKWNLAQMDSSIVRLHASTGERLGQWRLPDPRLSLRHLAWQGATHARNANKPLLGIALQAEHDSADDKLLAPVLAIFDGHALVAATPLQPVDPPKSSAGSASLPAILHGYGGDIAALKDGWAVSCPRAHGVAQFTAHGQWLAWHPLAHACALASAAQIVWSAGQSQALQLGNYLGEPQTAGTYVNPAIRLDNHWVVL